jgi:hypothetical protein
MPTGVQVDAMCSAIDDIVFGAAGRTLSGSDVVTERSPVMCGPVPELDRIASLEVGFACSSL